AMTLCERLLERRVFAQAIRPPTVPEGTSRLRITVSASHTPQELRRAAQAIAEVSRELGLPVGSGPARPSITKSDDSFGEWTAAPSKSRVSARPQDGVAPTSAPAPAATRATQPTGSAFFDVEQVDPSLVRASRGSGLGVRF
ncbi:MAG: aminotransferase class I/II-fold pyridoxal phosphate-dependent enzyme, partial [Solirubrobacteraceae bacterium]